jgi:cytoskeletal protein CcmA (bactofilin family)
MFTKVPQTNDRPTSQNEVEPTFTLIGPDTTFTGNIESQENLQIEGQVNGDINCDELVVTESGTVTGDIVAKSITVEGTVKGQVRTDNLRLRKTSRIDGGVTLKNWIVDSGAKVDATCHFVNENLDKTVEEEKVIEEVVEETDSEAEKTELEAKAVETALPKKKAG